MYRFSLQSLLQKVIANFKLQPIFVTRQRQMQQSKFCVKSVTIFIQIFVLFNVDVDVKQKLVFKQRFSYPILQ